MLSLLLLMLVPTLAAAQTGGLCPDDREPQGDPGIRGMSCSGPSAACAIHERDENGLSRHLFSVEPVIESVDRISSEATGVRAGDVLVAVDGRLITTLEGGRPLANLPVGQQVVMLLRREGELIQLTLPTPEGCGVRSLSVPPG